MAKNNMITRRGTSLNLNTGKGIKIANILADGDVSSDEDMAMYDAIVNNTANDIISQQQSDMKKEKMAKVESVLGKVGAGISGGIGLLNAYQQGASAYDTSKYDNALGQVDNSISIGSYDALADWRTSMPSLSTNINAKDLDNSTTGGKISNVLSAGASGAATGAQIGGGYGAAIGAALGVSTAAAGLLSGKHIREKLARDYQIKNSQFMDRINAMYNHELADINEENKNQAMANIEAKGGKIHIAPSKRGTFKAQAKRMGMSVQQAAAHILAHKDRYSPAMRKKANFARNFAHAYGGELFADGGMFEHPAEYTHGGFFSLDPELIKINQGGTHEMNPLDGVPMGFDENGIPNLVEEGETIFDDYVFSNRLAPDEKQLAEGGLPTKYKNHTFADISEKIGKQFEETPNDEIAKESMKESMQRLRTIQEEVKANQEAEETVNSVNDFAFAPEEEQQQMLGQEVPQEMAGVPEEMPQQPMPEEISQGEVPTGMEAYGNAPVDMMAFGGNLFVPGGDLDEEDENKYIIFNEETGKYEINKAAFIEDAENQLRGRPRREIETRAYRNSRATQRQVNRKNRELEGTKNNSAAEKFLKDKYGEQATINSPEISDEDRIKYADIKYGRAAYTQDISEKEAKPTTRATDGEAGTADKRKYNTTEDIAGLTAEQRRDAWYNSSGKALLDSLDEAKKDWTTRGLKGEDLKKARQEYADAMNAVQDAYVQAYEAGYDPKTKTANKDAAVAKLQELWEKNKGNKYFESLMPKVVTKGITGDNTNQGWKDDLWGAITRYRNWGLSEYFDSEHIPDDISQRLKDMRMTYSAKDPYGRYGYKTYKFGLKDDSVFDNIPTVEESAALQDPAVAINKKIDRPDVVLTPEQEKLKARTQRKLARQERRAADDSLPTWMRYAPVVGAGLSAIWDMAQRPDYSVAEAVENAARNVPRARFNPIGNYLTYRPLDRNYYLNQVRNQGLATDRAILNSTGANQGAATAALLASQYNTQNNIGNSLMQQELANRQNEQQVAQFNRGTDQYNSQGLFNESIYNQRAGMQKSQMGITAAQLRQAERQRRNAAISADLTNLFQGIGDIGWENMNMNMVNSTKAANQGYGMGTNGVVNRSAKGGMLTKKKSRRK